MVTPALVSVSGVWPAIDNVRPVQGDAPHAHAYCVYIARSNSFPGPPDTVTPDTKTIGALGLRESGLQLVLIDHLSSPTMTGAGLQRVDLMPRPFKLIGTLSINHDESLLVVQRP
jgi:hypothetical protein